MILIQTTESATASSVVQALRCPRDGSGRVVGPQFSASLGLSTAA